MVGNDFDKQLGLRLAKLREKKDWSQEQLREKTRIERRETITQWENGTRKIKAEHIIPLCEAFGISADFLLGLSKYPRRDPESVEKLGLSKEAVDSIHAIRNNTLSGILPEGCFEALDQFLKSDLLPAFLAFFSHAQKTARNTREMLEKAIIEQDNPSNGSNPGYDTYSALLNQESYPFARYTVVQSFSEMIDIFCNAAEIDRLRKQLSKRIDENAAARIKRAEEVPNGEHSEN